MKASQTFQELDSLDLKALPEITGDFFRKCVERMSDKVCICKNVGARSPFFGNIEKLDGVL